MKENEQLSYVTGARKQQYARRGPTYDEESLKSIDVVPPPSGIQATGLHAFGRGRGRGRGRAVPTQPLRRPAMPGIANTGTDDQQKVENQPSSSQDESPWSGSFGRGRGVRPPNTVPIGWAGPPTAPDASAAPLPPAAWQQTSSPGVCWPPFVARSSTTSTNNLHNDFQSFSLFDKDDYD